MKMLEHETRAFGVKDAARVCGVSRTTIYNWMKEGTLRTVKIRGRRLVPRDAVESLLENPQKP